MSISFDIFRGSQDGRIVPDKTTRVLQPHEAYVEITHSGLCGSDEHFLKSGNALGHEGVGIVRKLGKDVRNLRLGDRVGFGLIHYVCGNCEPCLTGKFWKQFTIWDFKPPSRLGPILPP
jgi:D-arabinose 1-dehydrogenase-like Zn-dependent alcohol dehydrogenase